MNLLGLEALDDELGDGLDGFPVERVFDNAHWYLDCHSGVGVAGCEGVHAGKDKVFGAEAVGLRVSLPLDDGEGLQHVARVVYREPVHLEVARVQPRSLTGGRMGLCLVLCSFGFW